MIVTIDQLIPLGLSLKRELEFKAMYGDSVEVTRARLLSPPLLFFPGLVAHLCPPATLASFHAAMRPFVDGRMRLDAENRAAMTSGRIGHEKYLNEESRIDANLRASSAHCLADALGLPMTGDGYPLDRKGCEHEYVNVGFTSVTMACRRCGVGREDAR